MKSGINDILGLLNSETGFTLLEVAFAGAILVIVGLAYLGTISQSISISQLYTDQNQANILIEREIEVLRNTYFDDIPYKQTSDAEKLKEVPDYFEDIAIAEEDPTKPGFVGSSGDLDDHVAAFAFDGLRTGMPGWNKWMASVNGPLKSGGFIPQTDEPIIITDPEDPGGDIIINPHDNEQEREINSDSQYIYIAFPSITKIHRVIYDNRFNVAGDKTLPEDDLDYRNQSSSIWQRDYQVFISPDEDIIPGIPFRPDLNSSDVIYDAKSKGYGSAGVIEVYNSLTEPLHAAVLGVANISVETDFDNTFHTPYVSEIEAYGYKSATNYVESYMMKNGEVDLGNYIIFMPNYIGSDFDLFRRVYVKEGEAPFPPILDKQELFRVQIEIYPHMEARNTSKFVRETWWQDDDNEIMSFTMTLVRDEEQLASNLPGLQDLPRHTYYFNDEDIKIDYTVPGADRLRAHFRKFDLQPTPNTDSVQFFDKNGEQYGESDYYGGAIGSYSVAGYSPWVEGDTMVIHFMSDDYLSSVPTGNLGGFEVDFVEIE
jgi:type II secretory pathway pseudopilin PulG